jgi:type I restriction enzyme M protein
MAIKKSELYSTLWASCDELRGGMDASQYKDYVLVMLFIKYISDKYTGVPYAPITVPQGASFKDMVALKGKPTIGDDINKKIIGKIAEANKLTGTIDVADFNNSDKLGSGQDMVKKLSNLIAIFENPALDFTKNRAEGDDILGDAYEYLMRHFAADSGKSKGQFYTPAEVSRIMSKIIGINNENSNPSTTVYDPTCGSGSLLLKVADEAEKSITIYGQENENATAGLARMNMILHNNPTAEIKRENTLANPLFLNENGALKTFDYVVANPPFSFKSWSNGVDAVNDHYERFQGYGVPPAKNGDYAFLLHIVKSLKTKGKGAVILPHGVLFRGNAEAEIRQNLIRKGYIKGIIGLPANLFYGTGIPACIIVLDKENADNRKGIFMIDASKGYMKDGNKNRLREQDIHKIVDVFNKQLELPKYSRMVSSAEIEQKEFNLNIPRYIDSTETEDIQNIDAHLNGGIPNEDIDALENYWKVYPSLKKHLFEKSKRDGFSGLKVSHDEIKKAIFSHPEFATYSNKVSDVFNAWKAKNIPFCKGITSTTKPKQFIYALSEDLLDTFSNLELIDKYDVYQHLMTYWVETMQDDCYLIVGDGWKAGNEVEWTKKEFEGKLIPKALLIKKYFASEQEAIEKLESERDGIASQLEELEEEHSGEEGIFSSLDKVNKGNVGTELKAVKDELKANKNNEELIEKKKILEQYIQLCDDQTKSNKAIKEAESDLNDKLIAKYKALSENEIKVLVVDDKWIAHLEGSVQNEMQRISQRLTQRIKELAERYETTMPLLLKEVSQVEEKVNSHLAKMGFQWN